MKKQEKLDKIADNIISAEVTPELSNQATQLVFGSGNPDADIVFIGEAPGKNEDIQGIPFVGAAGKVLDELLTSIKLNRDDVYITNIVKYRPPNNRDPEPKEKEAFWPYLLGQIKIIQPKVIVTLGRHSGEVFIPGLHISSDHGSFRTMEIIQNSSHRNIIIMPLYHPAAALYNGSLRETLKNDFQLLKQFIKTQN